MVRPRAITPPPEELIKLGEEMLEWVTQNKPTHLSEWFSIEKGILWKQWDLMCEAREFSPYYEQALSLVAKFSRDGTLDKSIAQRFLSLYHRDLKREERREKKFEAKLKKEADKEINQDLIDRHDAFNKQIDTLRKEKDKLKNAT